MTLLKQLWLVISLLFILIFCGTLGITFNLIQAVLQDARPLLGDEGQLYNQTALWFLGAALVFMLALLLALRILLNPLRTVTGQASAICKREFPIQGDLSGSTDVQMLVEAMNTMIIKLKHLLHEHHELNEMMRERAYKDMVTGLGNRRYFDNILDHLLNSTEGGMGGALFLIRVSNMIQYRHRWGYELSDILLKHIASLLSQLPQKHKIPLMCHFDESDFALVVMNIAYDQIPEFSNLLLDTLKKVNSFESIKEEILIHVGVSCFTQDAFPQDVLRKADQAAREAEKQGSLQWRVLEAPEDYSLYGLDWTHLLLDAMEAQEVYIQYQPVFFYEKKGMLLFHNEALMRLKGTSHNLLSAGLFLPMADRINLAVRFDQLMVERVLGRILDTVDGMQRYGVNLSEKTLQEPTFLKWLDEQCSQAGEMVSRLTLEIPEFCVKDNFEALKALIRCVKSYGVQVGLDHFGCGFSSFGYLEELKIDFIKIDGSFIRKIHQDFDNQMIVRSFIEICHGLDILVFATGVETEDEREALVKMRVDGMQGYLIGQPT